MTQWNFEKKIQGREDIELNLEGQNQAKAWADILRSEKFDLILCSTMIRAKETAQIIQDKINVDIEYDINLREQDFGQWEGRTIKDIRKLNPGQIETQESRGWEFCPPNGESRTVVLKRVLKAVETAAKRDEDRYILMVSHSSVIKTLVYKALNRNFTLDETAVLKDYHLHSLHFDKSLEIEKLNSINLGNCR